MDVDFAVLVLGGLLGGAYARSVVLLAVPAVLAVLTVLTVLTVLGL